jgi:hypothetical protein
MVTPIFGYGWWSADDKRRDVPSPFQLGCESPDSEDGIVLGDHEFSGAAVHLSPRHTTRDGVFNIEITQNGSLLALGYAEA